MGKEEKAAGVEEALSPQKPVAEAPVPDGDEIRFGRKSGACPYFSNFYVTPVPYDGITYKNSEAAWQAQKTLDPEDRKRFANYSGSKAKSEGRNLKLRPDWEKIKDQLMEEICYVKFSSNPELREKILKTGDKELVEDTAGWHDNYWGDCTCPKCIGIAGQNHLGRALMKVRSRLQTEA